jgi:hypothetical protein
VLNDGSSTGPVEIWKDSSFQRGLGAAILSTILAYMLGAWFSAMRNGPGAGIGWLFLYWEGLYWLQWVWLVPGIVVLAFFRRWRTAAGVALAGAIVSIVHAGVLIAVRSAGVN